MEVINHGSAIELVGHLDGRSSAELRVALYAHIGRHTDENVVVDMTHVESIDVTIFKVLTAAAVRLERTGHRVVLHGCSPALRRVFAFSGWRRHFVLEHSLPAGGVPHPSAPRRASGE